MRDILPVDKARRERVLAVIRRQFRRHGFDEIETPSLEDSDRLHAGLGGDNEKLAFAVMKRALKPADLASAAASEDPLELADLGLRFDLTVPLARFYASHRAELPTVFRSIQIGPAWRAERPQKGRYRQFIQCDIDVIGEEGILAETELLVATAATIDALGLVGSSIRVNDRRLLTSMLAAFGFSPAIHDSVFVTLDKMDKIAADGVIAELRANGADLSGRGGASPEELDSSIDALGSFLTRPRTLEFHPFGERAIRLELPVGADESAIADLVALGDAVAAAGIDRSRLQFDPFLVRGMGYYTGTIFEVAHPDLGYSLGGGGRYDGMIGRFLGTDVPAAGISLGFERLVDLVTLGADDESDAVALLYDGDVTPAQLARLKAELAESVSRVRLERRARNQKPLLDQLAASGFGRFAYVSSATRSVDELEFRNLS
jgi:histidyl-tRNA synthetase